LTTVAKAAVIVTAIVDLFKDQRAHLRCEWADDLVDEDGETLVSRRAEDASNAQQMSLDEEAQLGIGADGRSLKW
jgi:hypothetical protein